MKSFLLFPLNVVLIVLCHALILVGAAIAITAGALALAQRWMNK